ncbi:hybrid sensor histidine kinase/response regulator [Cytophaga aurantiaca]|uniref:hybrid sensor histidine kinase/response regulator n=1 Tax=Cytophaga aurantiaca TaxID=29530 RepID=UPI00038169F2|nr:ATP-binding protein [Cytophaga aurantiaca]
MKLSIRSLNLIFSIAFIVLISAYIYSYFNITALRSATKSVQHTNIVFLELESIYSDVKNAESGVRGYVITGDSIHIHQNHILAESVKKQLYTLDSLVSDNAEQKIFVDTLRKVIAERFFLFNQLALLSNSGARQNEVLQMMKKGHSSTDLIHSLIETMKKNEEELLVARNDRAESLSRATPTTIIISGVLGFIILGLAYLFIMKDLRERGALVKELEKKNRLLEYAQQVTQMGTFEYEIVNNKIYWSDEMYNIFDVSKGVAPEMGFIDSLILEDPEFLKERRKRIIKPNSAYSHEFTIRTLNGVEKILLTNGYVFADEHDKVTLVNGAVIDITALKRAEINALEKQELMRLEKEKAEMASQFKTRFLSNMSHEIRTPINAILGFTEILNKQKLSTEQKELLNNISVSGELLLKLIGNILDIGKIEEGKVVIENKSFYLKESIRSVLNPFKFSASEKGINFNLLIDENIPDCLKGDSARVSQVLVNLVGNALKFTSNGNVTVLLSLTDTKEDVCHVEFSVTDTGIGIQKDKQNKIFESFTQANDTISTRYGGAGLGLTIVREIVHLMKGTIHVTSPVYYDDASKGYGSRFYFTIPFKLGENNPEYGTKNISLKPFAKPVHVLVAEDNELNRILAQYTLDSLGCTYETVEDGLLAVEKASEVKFDIILMDMQMPECDGIEATRKLREQKNNVPIVGITANVFQEDIDMCLDAGMNAHLGKPYKKEDLYVIIEKLVFNTVLKGESNKYYYTNFSFIEKISNYDPLICEEMLKSFQYQNNELIKEIKDAVNKQNIAGVSLLLHQYKSCVRILDIKKQIALITDIEYKIKEKNSIESIVNELLVLEKVSVLIALEITMKLAESKA